MQSIQFINFMHRVFPHIIFNQFFCVLIEMCSNLTIYYLYIISRALFNYVEREKRTFSVIHATTKKLNNLMKIVMCTD